MTNHDPYQIIPRGAGFAVVKPLDLQVRIMPEFDVVFLQDRVRADVFINGRSTGIYAVAAVDDNRYPTPQSLQDAVMHYGPELERMAIDEFVGNRMRGKVEELDRQGVTLSASVGSLGRVSDEHWARINSLEAQVDALINRPRWHRRFALKIRSWFS